LKKKKHDHDDDADAAKAMTIPLSRLFSSANYKTYLFLQIRMKPEKVTRVIVACGVLHNLRILWKEPEDPQLLQPEDDQQPEIVLYEGRADGNGVRRHIVSRYFE
jgi:hypothetical protein